MLLVPSNLLTVPWVMGAQALSGIAKDLNKMSAKSAIKLLVPSNAESQLYKWVALLTGSKNALKGVGFFLGGALLSLLGFTGAIISMVVMLTLTWFFSLIKLKKDLGKAKTKPKFTDLFSKSHSVNVLSAARLFLFGARDVWFVVALPVYLASTLHWDHWYVGGFLACWVIGYGIVQSFAPHLTGKRRGKTPTGQSAVLWAIILGFTPAIIALSLTFSMQPIVSVIGGLMLFGIFFAINSSLHSYLIVSFAAQDGVSLDIGFYYMANAMGRLIGTVLSGWVYQEHGLIACLWVSTLFITITALISLGLPKASPTGQPRVKA